MNCQQCQAAIPVGAKFCMNCGAALPAGCPNCQAEIPAGAKFCGNCGHALGAAAAAPTAPPVPEPASIAARDRLEQYIPKELLAKLESARAVGGMQGERRVVTMLFCDVQGSTAAAEQLDPEEWASIMNGAFDYLIQPVYRYEGTLARLMGDAILAFFGAPIGHEDDPQRAIMAGLDIIEAINPYRERVRKEWGIDFNVRVGINTGLVVVGEVGTDLRVEYTAMGDAVNLAARMEQTAQPGTVQVTENTYRLAAPLLEVEELGGIEVKGKSEPVPAYRIVGMKEQPGRLRGIDGLESPLVGRDNEMASLRTAVDEVRQGRGQIVSIMGEAGLGKSRLTAELRHALIEEGALDTAVGGQSQGLAWHEGRCQSFEMNRPYAPFIDLVSSLFGLATEPTPEGKYASIAEQVQAVVPGPVIETAPFIAKMLGIELSGEELEKVRYLDPPLLRERVFRSISDFVEATASQRPMVLLFEDLHWSDTTSLDLVEQLLPITERAMLMILGLFRPQRQEPSWRLHETADREYGHRYNPIQLRPLDDTSARQLVANLLYIEGLPESVRSLILSKAEGNPFFVEEVIRSLLDAGLVVPDGEFWKATKEIEGIAVPDTLVGVLTARLDRLDDDSKRASQTAAVIGREFDFDVLSAVGEAEVSALEGSLSELQRRELVREKSRMPQRLYSFKHGLTQEAAYDSLLLSRRRELHKRIAEYLEEHDSGRKGAIARNYFEAREYERALPYLVEAGERAAAAYSTPEAIGFLTKALDIVDTVPEVPLARRAYEGLGAALAFANQVPASMDIYQKMYDYAGAHWDPAMQVSALNKMAFNEALRIGDGTSAIAHLEKSEELANGCQDMDGLAELHMIHCYIQTAMGNFDGAYDHLSEADRLGRALGAEVPRLFGLSHISNTLNAMTRFDEAWEVTQEAVKLAEETGHRGYHSELLAMTVPMHYLREGDLRTASEISVSGLEMAKQIGNLVAESEASFNIGSLARLTGDYEQALTYLKTASSAGRMSGMTYLEATPLCILGSVYLDISPNLMDKVAEYHSQVDKLLEQPLGGIMASMVWAELGFCALAAGNVDKAKEYFEKGLSTPTAVWLVTKPQHLMGCAMVSMMRGDLEGAGAQLAEAIAYAEERRMRYFYPFLALAEGMLSNAQGEAAKAIEDFQRAEDFALEMGMRPIAWQAQASAAGVLAAQGRSDEAAAKVAQAREVIDEIGGLFQDVELRQVFLDNAAQRLA